MPRVLISHVDANETLAKVMDEVKGKKNHWFKYLLRCINSKDAVAELSGDIQEKMFETSSFMNPERIEWAYELIGIGDVFGEIAQQWQGPNTTREGIKRKLSTYGRRRHKIVHESDLDANGFPRPIRNEYARGCKNFVTSLVDRLERRYSFHPDVLACIIAFRS